MHRSLFVAVVCSLFVIPAVAEDEPPLKADAVPDSVTRYVAACQSNRVQSAVRLQERIAETKAALRKPGSRERANELNANLKQLTKYVKDNNESLRPVRLSSYPKLKVGLIGQIDGVTLDRIIDGTTAIATPKAFSGNQFVEMPEMYVTGIRTAGKVDGEYIEGPLVIEIVGTKKVGGTIYAADLVPFDTWKPIVNAKLKPKFED